MARHQGTSFVRFYSYPRDNRPPYLSACDGTGNVLYKWEQLWDPRDGPRPRILVFCPWCSGLASRMLPRGWVVTSTKTDQWSFVRLWYYCSWHVSSLELRLVVMFLWHYSMHIICFCFLVKSWDSVWAKSNDDIWAFWTRGRLTNEDVGSERGDTYIVVRNPSLYTPHHVPHHVYPHHDPPVHVDSSLSMYHCLEGQVEVSMALWHSSAQIRVM